MKSKIYSGKRFLQGMAIALAITIPAHGFAQDTTVTTTDTTVVADEQAAPVMHKVKPAKNTFGSIWIIDNQTVMVPIKKSFEMDIMHRFGTIKNGYEDFYGFFAPSNIRLGFNYVPINNLLVGLSITKQNMTWEGYAKYALIKQTTGQYPVSISYYGNVAVDSRKKDNFLHSSDRLMYFNQLLIARKLTPKLSVQVAPSLTHINIVNGYFKSEPTGKPAPDSLHSVLYGEMKHNHIAIAFSGRYQIKTAMAAIVNIDQPVTKHATGNPRPNVSFGIELSTSAHAFQFFLGNYSSITPERNNLFNKNDYTNGEFLIGFNIPRIWNY
jgi:hypothetical protein